MSRRLRQIEKLLRLRGLERDLASSRLAAALRDEREANTSLTRSKSVVRGAERGHRELLEADPIAGRLGISESGRRRMRQIAAIASHALDTAFRESASRREDAIGAERQVRSIETLAKRVQSQVRRDRVRKEQKHIDEVAARTRGLWKRLVCVAGVCVLLTPAVAESKPDAITPGLEASFSAIRVRQAEQDRRERELADRERKLRDLESAVIVRLGELEDLSERVDARIATWKEAEGGKSIGRLSRIYAQMPPARAADLVATLDLELATQIVAKMKPKQSSALLALLEREQARRMSELIAHPLSMEPASIPEDLQ